MRDKRANKRAREAARQSTDLQTIFQQQENSGARQREGEHFSAGAFGAIQHALGRNIGRFIAKRGAGINLASQNSFSSRPHQNSHTHERQSLSMYEGGGRGLGEGRLKGGPFPLLLYYALA